MAGETIYVHNSIHKEFIRDRWVEFATEMRREDSPFGLITFPAEEMQDLHLFQRRGLIDWEVTETGAFSIKKGKVVCFEKSNGAWIKLKSRLTNAIVERDEIGAYFRNKYPSIMNKTSKIFPVDMINLDYDGNISKNNVPIDETINLIFTYQALYKKHFSLFITWPSTESEDELKYKELLKSVIEDNLNDPRTSSFKVEFNKIFGAINDLSYENLSVIGLTKLILKKSSPKKYSLNKNEFYLYGGGTGKRRMFSILLNFNYKENHSTNKIYSEDVPKALAKSIDLNIPQKKPK